MMPFQYPLFIMQPNPFKLLMLLHQGTLVWTDLQGHHDHTLLIRTCFRAGAAFSEPPSTS